MCKPQLFMLSIHNSLSQHDIMYLQVTTIIKIADTSCNMSKGFLEHIWDSFSQEHHSKTDEKKVQVLEWPFQKFIKCAKTATFIKI